jgi:hypothetical protein
MASVSAMAGRTFLSLAVFCICAGAAAAELTPPRKLALSRALQDKVATLLSQKNAAGLPFQRGRYAAQFRETGPDAWQAIFHRETATEDALLWDGPDAYHAALYAKGPYLFHMMRSIWGADRFFAFLRALARQHRGQEIVTLDIQKVAEQQFGEKVDWFFDQWIRGIGIPEYTLRTAQRPAEGGGVVVTGEVSQRVLASARLRPRRIMEGVSFRAVVYLTAEGKSGKEHQHRLHIKGPVTTFEFSLPEKPKSIVLNKYGETLAHDVIIPGD